MPGSPGTGVERRLFEHDRAGGITGSMFHGLQSHMRSLVGRKIGNVTYTRSASRRQKADDGPTWQRSARPRTRPLNCILAREFHQPIFGVEDRDRWRAVRVVLSTVARCRWIIAGDAP